MKILLILLQWTYQQKYLNSNTKIKFIWNTKWGEFWTFLNIYLSKTFEYCAVLYSSVSYGIDFSVGSWGNLIDII